MTKTPCGPFLSSSWWLLSILDILHSWIIIVLASAVPLSLGHSFLFSFAGFLSSGFGPEPFSHLSLHTLSGSSHLVIWLCKHEFWWFAWAYVDPVFLSSRFLYLIFYMASELKYFIEISNLHMENKVLVVSFPNLLFCVSSLFSLSNHHARF